MNTLRTKIEITQYRHLHTKAILTQETKKGRARDLQNPNLLKSRLVYILNVRSSYFGRYPPVAFPSHSDLHPDQVSSCGVPIPQRSASGPGILWRSHPTALCFCLCLVLSGLVLSCRDLSCLVSLMRILFGCGGSLFPFYPSLLPPPPPPLLPVLSCPVLSCRFVSIRVVSCRVVSCRVVSCLVLSCLVLSCLGMSCLVLSCLVLSCLVFSYLVFSCCYDCLRAFAMCVCVCGVHMRACICCR
jgi:hypothetical protein